MDNLVHHCRSPLVSTIALALGTFTIAILAQLNNLFDPWATHKMAQRSFLSNLRLEVSQAPIPQPAITISVTNTHSSVPVTILKWNSPLDPAALGLGLVDVIPARATEPIHIDAIKVSRLMPPTADSLVTLLPGERSSNTIGLRDPIVPKSIWDAGPAKVRISGRWMAVWPELTKEDILADTRRLQSIGAGVGSLTGNWESEYIEVSYLGNE